MTKNPNIDTSITPADQFRFEYDRQRALFNAQPLIVQRFFEAQASQVAEAFINREHSVRFMLPDRVILAEKDEILPVPQNMRYQRVGDFRDRLANLDIHDTLRRRLTELEQSSDQSVVVSAGLIRFATATHMVHNMLPSGKMVTYTTTDKDDIPSIPIKNVNEQKSAITASTDAIAEEENNEDERGNLQVPYVSTARRFYLPQWVAFDENGKILVNSTSEAQADIASMQHFLNVLFAARSLAPWMVADKEFETKRYGMLGQLVNQGRALANFQTSEIIRTIKERVSAQSLNRGLSLSLPYFDDQVLEIRTHDFVVIPAGRIMFVPAFVVRAALEEQAKLAQDTRFNNSTRKHLMSELQTLGDAFSST